MAVLLIPIGYGFIVPHDSGSYPSSQLNTKTTVLSQVSGNLPEPCLFCILRLGEHDVMGLLFTLFIDTDKGDETIREYLVIIAGSAVGIDRHAGSTGIDDLGI